MEKIKVGLVSFTENRDVDLVDETVQYEQEQHKLLRDYLEKSGFKVINITRGIKDIENVKIAIDNLKHLEAECLVIGTWKWTETMLAVKLVKEMNLPTLLFGKSDDNRTALGCMMAIGSALWEIAANKHMLSHERVLNNYDKVAKWVRGAGAWKKMQQQSILLWGGSYCLKMSHLEDDNSKLKSFLIGDILNESEYILIKKAEEILENEPERINKFEKWLADGNCNVVFDDKMLSHETIQKQIALYLASRTRLEELASEGIVGVSIHCQPALSIYYGVTGCFLPAFLPFGMDSEGERQVVATVCEGDIKGLLTSVMLQNMSGGQPTGFGDIRTLKDGEKTLLLIGNCGGASIFYANNSNKDNEVLPNVKICAQCQGKAGGCVGYSGKSGGITTVARLIRINSKYIMQFGVGDTVEVTDEMKERLEWGKNWPQIAIDLSISDQRMAEIFGSNHFSLVLGDFSKEIEFFCKQAEIECVKIN